MDIRSRGLRFLEMCSILVLALTCIPNAVNHLNDGTRRVVGPKLPPILDASLRIPKWLAPTYASVALTAAAAG
jgi:hypothetical protein